MYRINQCTTFIVIFVSTICVCHIFHILCKQTDQNFRNCPYIYIYIYICVCVCVLCTKYNDEEISTNQLLTQVGNFRKRRYVLYI